MAKNKATERKSRGRPAQEEVEHADRRMGRDVAKVAPARLEYSREIFKCTREMPHILSYNRVLSRMAVSKKVFLLSIQAKLRISEIAVEDSPTSQNTDIAFNATGRTLSALTE